MAAAISGLIGVIAGAIITGVGKSISAFMERRLASRTAARLLYMALFEAHAVLETTGKEQRWGAQSDDWGRFGRSWEKHQQALARVLETQDFMTVSAAFVGINRITNRRTIQLQPGEDGKTTEPNRPEDKTVIVGYLSGIFKAEKIVWSAAFPWKERNEIPVSPLTEILTGLQHVDVPKEPPALGEVDLQPLVVKRRFRLFCRSSS